MKVKRKIAIHCACIKGWKKNVGFERNCLKVFLLFEAV